ncbi:MAG: hypothetical protein ACOC0Q_10940 [Wenzhouxiangella sp.]
MTQGPDHPNPKAHWKNSRGMAWAALVAGILYPLLVELRDSDKLLELAWVFYLFVGGIAGAFVGSDIWEKVAKMRGSPSS